MVTYHPSAAIRFGPNGAPLAALRDDLATVAHLLGGSASAREFEAGSPTADDTRRFGRRLAALLRAGDLVLLSGGLGAGKTTLTQGIGDGLGVRGPVTSPTFVIARVHPSLGDGPPLVHVDAYRLGGLAEVDDLDLDASLDESVTVVEWGEGKVEDLSDERLEVFLHRLDGPDYAADESRTVSVRPIGSRWTGVDLAALVDRLNNDDDACADVSEVPEERRVAQPLADAPGGERLAQVVHGLGGVAAVVARDRVEADRCAGALAVGEAHHVLHRLRAHAARRPSRLRVDAVVAGGGLREPARHEIGALDPTRFATDGPDALQRDRVDDPTTGARVARQIRVRNLGSSAGSLVGCGDGGSRHHCCGDGRGNAAAAAGIRVGWSVKTPWRAGMNSCPDSKPATRTATTARSRGIDDRWWVGTVVATGAGRRCRPT